MASDEFTYLNDDQSSPVVEGGTYVRTRRDGCIESGTIMGVIFDATTLRKKGWYYSHQTGPVPVLVVEGTATMHGMTLVAAPSQQAGRTLLGQHRARLLEKAEQAKAPKTS